MSFTLSGMPREEVVQRGKNAPPAAPLPREEFRGLLPGMDEVQTTVELAYMHVPVEEADSVECMVSLLREVPPELRAVAQIEVKEYAGSKFCRVTVSYPKTVQKRRTTVHDIRKALRSA